ncbi:Esterase OVCA2 [Lepeophtheirus salmonis]|uniref:Esterase OVCA2 n=1 Tax=Lepeophtheirus salmonis TaxID=72036 RepID=A0A7R8H8L3_LEPSM|nr:Esterase OVCA2 [Lepeophtheirus salmonis]CAF2941964.1 Esterase OVCA2 [Lepeophtheirus salmonis]
MNCSSMTEEDKHLVVAMLSSKSPIVLRYNPYMVDSLKCLFFVKNRPEAEPVIDSVEDKSHPFCDPKKSITEWLDYSKFEIVPYIWSSKGDKLESSLQRLDTFFKSSEFLIEEEGDYTIADASLAIDLTPALIYKQFDPLKYSNINKWYIGIFQKYPTFKEMNQRIQGILTGNPKNHQSQVPRILCIHGYLQTANSFKLKLGAFMKLFKKKVEFVFVDSPHMIGEELTDDEDPPRAWWFSNENKTYRAFEESSIHLGLNESVQLILDRIHNDNIDGILCFSQGASLISWMAMEGKLRHTSIKFIILVAAFKSSSLEYSSHSPICGIPSLHVVGNSDKVISPENSKEILEHFDKESSRVLFHSGGHFVPAKSAHKQIYLNFIENHS